MNRLLRLGLRAQRDLARRRKRLVVKARPLGAPPGMNYDDMEGLIELTR